MQPLAGFVAVSVYVPAEIAVAVALDPKPLLHEKVAPAVVLEPSRVTEALLHNKILSAPALTLGGIVFCVTVLDAVALQPLDGSVAVTV